MQEENTNWGQSVAGVLIRDNKILLARHTYGNGKGMLIIPGGYVLYGETPQDAIKREFFEEVGLNIKPDCIIGIRFNSRDWYVIFKVEYISGIAKSDNDENSEVVWLDISEALEREDVPDLTRKIIRCALNDNSFNEISYNGSNPPYSFFGSN